MLSRGSLKPTGFSPNTGAPALRCAGAEFPAPRATATGGSTPPIHRAPAVVRQTPPMP